MPADFHAGLFSIKNVHQLIMDMHWNAKRLVGQSVVFRGYLNDYRNAIKKYIEIGKKKGMEEAQKQREKILKGLEVTLKKIEELFVVEGREQDLIVRYGATAEKLTLEGIKGSVIKETRRLVATNQIPRAYGEEVRKKVGEQLARIRGDIKKDAQIALDEKRGNISFRMAFDKACLITKSERGMARREKGRGYRAIRVLDKIEELERRIKKEEQLHEIDRIKDDLIKEAKLDAKVSHFIAADILFCLIFMDQIRKDFKELKEEIKKIGSPLKLMEILKKIEKEWQEFINDISRVLQQLRFFVAPGEAREMMEAA